MTFSSPPVSNAMIEPIAPLVAVSYFGLGFSALTVGAGLWAAVTGTPDQADAAIVLAYAGLIGAVGAIVVPVVKEAAAALGTRNQLAALQQQHRALGSQLAEINAKLDAADRLATQNQDRAIRAEHDRDEVKRELADFRAENRAETRKVAADIKAELNAGSKDAIPAKATPPHAPPQ